MKKTITLPPVKRGDTWCFTFSWRNNNTPIDLTDCTAKMQIRGKRTDNLVAEATSDDDSILIDGITGVVKVTFSASVTAQVPHGTYDTDIQLTFPVTGYVQSSDTMQIIVNEDVTK